MWRLNLEAPAADQWWLPLGQACQTAEADGHGASGSKRGSSSKASKRSSSKGQKGGAPPGSDSVPTSPVLQQASEAQAAAVLRSWQRLLGAHCPAVPGVAAGQATAAGRLACGRACHFGRSSGWLCPVRTSQLPVRLPYHMQRRSCASPAPGC